MMDTLEKYKSRLKSAVSNSGDSSGAERDLKAAVLDRLEDGRKVTAETIDEAINLAVVSVSETSRYTKEQIEQAAARLRSELEAVRDSAAGASQSAMEKVTPPRPKTRFLVLASAAMGVGSFVLGWLGSKPRTTGTFETGEAAGPGLFVCHNCDTRLQLAAEMELPECSSCHQKKFSKIR